MTAAQAGARTSWGRDFRVYTVSNRAVSTILEEGRRAQHDWMTVLHEHDWMTVLHEYDWMTVLHD